MFASLRRLPITCTLATRNVGAAERFVLCRALSTEGSSKSVSMLRTSSAKKGAYPLVDALQVVKDSARAKFDETVEVHMKLNFNPRATNESVRGVVKLPHGTGKNVRVAVFAKGEKAEEARAAGADIVGDDDLQKQIMAGKLDFERCLATPDMMGVVGKVARVLGPRGMMPNPKVGTLTQEIGNAVKEAKAGQVEFRVDKTGCIHAGVGKISFDNDNIAENIMAVKQAVESARPSAIKELGWIKSMHVTSTMGKAAKVEV